MLKRAFGWAVFVFLSTASTTLIASDKKPVVFVADKNSVQLTSTDQITEVSGGGSGNAMTTATIKDMNRTCPAADVTLYRKSADYVLMVGDTHGFPMEKDKQAVVAAADGRVLYSASARLLGSAVKDACNAIVKDWSQRSTAKAMPAN
jgi:hypothetical protein